jgi:uncharacterized protein (DUF2252 family)
VPRASSGNVAHVPTHVSRLQREHAPILSQNEAVAEGKAARTVLPRERHAHYDDNGRRDPLEILAEQNATRVPELVPLRMGRMLESPFTFYRGTAGIMAADLARGVDTGIRVVSCGDAHLSNFGLFASPQRNVVFDLNDFDEAADAPWEWDVKRLVTSVVIGGRASGFDEDECRKAATASARAYRAGLQGMMAMTALERYYFRIDSDEAHPELDSAAQRVVDRAVRQARRRTSDAYVEKISELAGDGTRLIIENPPVLTHVPEATETEIEQLFERYRKTVSSDVALLLSQFTLTDLARRVVGVGSVGTRCYILILTGPQRESLVLQVKEAQPSVLESYGGIDSAYPGGAKAAHAEAEGPQEGFRVVANQRILQAVSDSFLGYLRANGRDYYVRQFRDMKGSIDVSKLDFSSYVSYVRACATLLARAHAQSADAPKVAGYLGKSKAFDSAVVDWSFAYAERSLADYERFTAAVAAGEIEVITGV